MSVTKEKYSMFPTAILVASLFVGVMLVIRGTSVRNKWGVSFSSAQCAHCGTPSREGVCWPKSTHEFLWGGWTCRVCGTQNDKWGGKRVSGTLSTREPPFAPAEGG